MSDEQTTTTTKVEVPDELEKATEVHEASPAPEETAAPIDEAKVDTRSVEDLMSDGSEKLAKSDYAAAAELFAFAVEKLVEKHGELAVETVDALEAYGNALLKNAIAQSGVLGNNANASKAKKEGNDDAPPTASTSKTESPKEPLTAANINFHFGGDGEDDEDDGEEGDDGDDAANQTGEGEVDPEDDLETAWGILDTARTILAKQNTDERKLQLARVHCSMAEVATESARPEDGVKEYEAALAIQAAVLPKWDRLTAQTHLFIALALELIPNNQFDAADEETKIAEESYSKAIDHIRSAKAILGARADYLKQKDAADADSKPSEKDLDELKDIDELQGELDNKIDDLKAQAAEAKDKQKSLDEQIYQKGPSLPESVSREVHNLNTLVKKKPKKVEPQKGPSDRSTATTATNGTNDADVTNGTDSTHEPKTKGTVKTEDDDDVKAGSMKRKAEDDVEAESATSEKRPKTEASN